MSDKTKNFLILLLVNVGMIAYLFLFVGKLFGQYAGYEDESTSPSLATANQIKMYIIVPFVLYVIASFYLYMKGVSSKAIMFPTTILTVGLSSIFLGLAESGSNFGWMIILSVVPFGITLLVSIIVGIIVDGKESCAPKELGNYFLTFDTDNKIGEVDTAKVWNTKGTTNEEFGGFLFADAKNILYFLDQGNLIYNVTIPNDAEVFEVLDSVNPHTMYRCNKIVLSNPRQITDDIAMRFYGVSNMSKEAYYHAMAVCAVNGYDRTANQILLDMVSFQDEKEAYAVWQKYINEHNKENCNETVTHIESVLTEHMEDNDKEESK